MLEAKSFNLEDEESEPCPGLNFTKWRTIWPPRKVLFHSSDKKWRGDTSFLCWTYATKNLWAGPQEGGIQFPGKTSILVMAGVHTVFRVLRNAKISSQQPHSFRVLRNAKISSQQPHSLVQFDWNTLYITNKMFFYTGATLSLLSW